MQSYVKCNGHSSRVFHVRQGVGQGRVLSAWLFTLYINDLLHELDSSRYGLCLPWGKTPGILLADDTTLLSCSTSGMQGIMNIVYNYANKWHLKFNASKSAILVFNNNCNQLSPNVYIGKNKLPVKTSVVYAGVRICTSRSTSAHTLEVCEKLRLLVNVNHNHGLYFGGLNPLHAIRIWQNVILPCALYGCNVWCELSTKEYDMLERVQKYFSKKVQGLSKRSNSTVARSCLSLIPIKSYIEQRTLIFLGRLIHADFGFVLLQNFLQKQY